MERRKTDVVILERISVLETKMDAMSKQVTDTCRILTGVTGTNGLNGRVMSIESKFKVFTFVGSIVSAVIGALAIRGATK